MQTDRKIVLGLGNLLLGDEGFGIHALQYERSRLETQYSAEWIDGGVLGLNLLPLVEECSHLLVLDALDAGEPGGSIIELAGEAIPLYVGLKMSEHQLGFQEVLALARLRGTYPAHVHLVGVQPVSLLPGVELSQEVRRRMPEVTGRAAGILKCWCG